MDFSRLLITTNKTESPIYIYIYIYICIHTYTHRYNVYVSPTPQRIFPAVFFWERMELCGIVVRRVGFGGIEKQSRTSESHTWTINLALVGEPGTKRVWGLRVVATTYSIIISKGSAHIFYRWCTRVLKLNFAHIGNFEFHVFQG